MNYLSEVLNELPTQHEGHTSDLKIETKNWRVWLSRVTKRPEIEQKVEGSWVLVKD